MPAPKAFLTFLNGTHTSYFGDARTRNTFLDWARWGLYGDTAALNRLPADASSSGTTWQLLHTFAFTSRPRRAVSRTRQPSIDRPNRNGERKWVKHDDGCARPSRPRPR